jgi:lysine biosynthesis protein LysW
MIGEVVGCEQCQAELEVTDLDPLVLELAAKVEVEEEDFRR